MPEPIVFISRFRVLEGKRGDLASMFAGAVEVIAATKPRTALYAAYEDATGSDLEIIHAFPDASAITAHFEGSEARSEAASRLIAPAGFALYGQVPDAIVRQMEREAAGAGVDLTVRAGSLGGFLR